PAALETPHPADRYGIENSNRGCTLVDDPTFVSRIPRSSSLGGGFGLGVITGKKDVMDSLPNIVNPGGVPIFYQNVVLGGIGGGATPTDLNGAEDAAFAGASTERGAAGDNFGPTPAAPGVVFLGGVALPFVAQATRPAGFSAGPVAGGGSFLVAPASSQGQPPDGDL